MFIHYLNDGQSVVKETDTIGVGATKLFFRDKQNEVHQVEVNDVISMTDIYPDTNREVTERALEQYQEHKHD
jgi:hypothetical protein